ncbi:hypothetical protein FOA52_010279 [Chlamydomonas sp. UWO 241]|nr:hypothetical protein FOA52_010279 [Chlamydomonas sp. UWO 241]
MHLSAMRSTVATRTARASGIGAPHATCSSRTVVAPMRAQREQGAFRSSLESAAFSLGTAALVVATSLALQFAPPAEAKLTAGDPIKNAQAILRYALPIDNKPIRSIQKELESVSDALRVPGSKSLGRVSRSVNSARSTLDRQRGAIEAAFAPEKRAAGMAALASLDGSLAEFQKIIDFQDKQEVPLKQREALVYVGAVEEAMVNGFPYEVPAEYASRPLLKGRATLGMRVDFRETPQGPQTLDLKIVLDGYSAPVSAGQFMDLVNKGFYNGMTIQRADGFVVQTGDPDGPDDGYRDPATGKIRTVPFELRVEGQTMPIYDETLEDLGRVNEQPILPFNAYGTLAMARNEFENNSASSQVFFLLRESELTPSGSNMLDGRFAVFGYVIEGQDTLGYMKVGDKIEFIKVTEGAENLVNA